MNTLTFALIGLRGAALALELQGQTRSANTLYALADAAEAGKNVEAHMARVAELLKNREVTDEDWEDVMQRVAKDSDRLQAPG